MLPRPRLPTEEDWPERLVGMRHRRRHRKGISSEAVWGQFLANDWLGRARADARLLLANVPEPCRHIYFVWLRVSPDKHATLGWISAPEVPIGRLLQDLPERRYCWVKFLHSKHYGLELISDPLIYPNSTIRQSFWVPGQKTPQLHVPRNSWQVLHTQ